MTENLRLILVLARMDFRKRYIGSFLGVIWMCVQPVVSVVIYYCVFQLGFKNNPVESIPYVVWLVPGIVPWFFFNDAVQNGVGTFLAYKNWVKKLSFNIDTLPLVRVTASFMLHIFFVIVTIIVLLIYGCKPSFWWAECLYYMLANFVLITAIVFLTASLNVFIKDVGQFVGVLLQFGFWLAPIMYEPEIMPDWIQQLLKWNPFTYIVRGFRDSFLFETGFWEKPSDTVQFWVITGIICLLAWFSYRRVKPYFADAL